MQSVKDTLDYICNILQHFGLTSLSPEEIRKSKFDQGDRTISTKFILLIYELSLLHIGDYKLKFTKVDKDFDDIGAKLESIKKFVIHYLYCLKCPFLIVTADKVILKTSSSRNLLLLLGWLIYKTNLFEVYNASLLNEVQQFFSKFVVNKPVYEDNLFETFSTDKKRKFDINEVITVHKRIKHQYNKLLKLIMYENQQETQLRKSIEGAQGKLTFDEYQFLKQKENLPLLAEAFEKMNRMLDYEISHIKHRKIFWEWLESVVDEQKKTVVQDPDYGFEDVVPQEDLKSLERSPITPLQKITGDLEDVFKTYEQYKEKIKEFKSIWETESEKLQDKKRYPQLDKQFKLVITQAIKDLEQKYPSLDTLKNTTEGLGVFFGEIATQLQSMLSESKEESYLELQKLSSYIVKGKEDSMLLKKELENVIQKYTDLLPKDIKVFPI